MPALPLLLEPAELEPLLDEPSLLIVDMRAEPAYLDAHIPGAVRLDYSAIVAARPPVGGLLPDADALGRVLGAIGVTPQHHVVAYDDEGCGRAARLLWTLDVLGHDGFSLLNGGLVAWAQERRPLQSGAAAPVAAPGAYPAALANPDAVADREIIGARLHRDDVVLLDTRSPAEYAGLDVRAARGGHIPGAINFNWTDAIDADNATRLHADALLRARLRSLGVTPDKEIITYCQTHHRSSHTYIVLKHLGYPRVRGYHGAWSDWGNAPDTPVAAAGDET